MPKKITLPVASLIDLYVKGYGTIDVYWSPQDGEKGKPIAWKVKEGQVIGKLDSWIDLANPNYGSAAGKNMYLMFYGTAETHGKSFYVKVKKNTFNWAYVQTQIDSNRRAQMSWYGKWFEDLEKEIVAYGEELKNAAWEGLGIGLAIVGTLLTVKYIIIPEMQVRRIERGLTKVVREARK